MTAQDYRASVYRTVDGGQTWNRHDSGELDPVGREPGWLPMAFLTGDDRLVLIGYARSSNYRSDNKRAAFRA